jgi:hypothetical protein
MNVRWPFFLTLPAGLLLAFSGYLILFQLQLGVPTEQSRWCWEMVRKKSQKAQSITEPKLLLVGGSSVLFGISAEEIQRQTGCPTVNFGTHAAISSAYMMELTRRIAQPGDTVLLALEWELYEKDSRILRASSDSIFNDYIVARDSEYVKRLPWRERFNLAMLTPGKRVWLGLMNRFAGKNATAAPVPEFIAGAFNPYRSESLNEFGDQTGATKARRPANAPSRARLIRRLAEGLPDNPAGFPTIRAFCEWASTNRVRVLATFPNTCHRPEYDRAEARKTPLQLHEFYRQQGVPVLGEAAEAILPESEFFDTMYHLTEEACRTRTQRLLPHLIPYLPSKSAAPGTGTPSSGTPAR